MNTPPSTRAGLERQTVRVSNDTVHRDTLG